MQPSDKPRFMMALVAMSEYYDKPLTEGALELWWRDLAPYDIAALEAAFHQHRKSDAGQFMPKVADIVRLIGGSTEDRALRAWAMVERAVRTVGAYQSVVFDDAISMRVIYDMGGWERLCAAPTEKDFEFTAREFCTRYRGFAMQGGAVEHPACLPGAVERSNNALGFKQHLPQPVLVGDRAKASLILLAAKPAPPEGMAAPALERRP